MCGKIGVISANCCAIRPPDRPVPQPSRAHRATQIAPTAACESRRAITPGTRPFRHSLPHVSRPSTYRSLLAGRLRCPPTRSPGSLLAR